MKKAIQTGFCQDKNTTRNKVVQESAAGKNSNKRIITLHDTPRIGKLKD